MWNVRQFIRTKFKKQIHELLNHVIVKSSISSERSLIWIVPNNDLDNLEQYRKGKRKWPKVIDYRKLNHQTIGD